MAYNQRSRAMSGDVGSTNKEELNKILEERRKQKMADPQAAIQAVNADALKQNELANVQRIEVMNNSKIPIEQRVQARNEYMAANPDMQQPGVSGNQIAAGAGAASQVSGAMGSPGGGVVQGALGGAAAGAGTGAAFGGTTGPQGALIGAGIGAAVGTAGAIMQQQAAKKARKQQAQSTMFQQQASIEAETEQKRQNAYKGMMDSLRSAFIWS